MKKLISSVALTAIVITSPALYAEKSDDNCTNSSAYDLAYEAKHQFEKTLNDIPGALKIEVETCNEEESYGVTAGNMQCGVFVWFEDEDKRAQFHHTTSLWGGKLKLANGQTVPVCSKASLQLMSKGPY